MRKFEFKNQDLNDVFTIEINKKKFQLSSDLNKVLKICEAYKDFVKDILLDICKNSEDEKKIKNLKEQSYGLIEQTINELFYENAYKEIFQERPIDFIEHQSVMKFIFEEITEFLIGRNYIKDLENKNEKYITESVS